MNYRLTGFKNKGRDVFAKDGCKTCHGTGKSGTMRPIPGVREKYTVILCRCCTIKKEVTS